MARIRHTGSDAGWIGRELATIRRELREQAAAKRLPASTYPAGSIPTTALAQPVAPGAVQQSASGFAVAAAGAVILTSTITVPSGMTSCVVSLVGRCYATNTTAAADTLYARVEVSTVTGTALPVGVPAADARTNVATLTTLLTGLSGGATFTVRVWAQSVTANWTASGGNTVDLSGTLSWFA